MKNPFVSVVVPVYNDPERVKICLKALEKQTYPDELYEVVLVDNNSRHKPDVSSDEYPHLVFTEEKTPGPSAARNKGIIVSKGDVIAFTDSDCIPEKDWIERGVDFLTNNPDIGIIGGRVDVFPEDENNPNAIELWEMVSAFPQKNFIENFHYAATANVFTYKKAIDKSGVFNEKMLYGEDREWTNRIHNNGYKIAYADDVLVLHPARKNFNEFYRKWYHYLYGAYTLDKEEENFVLKYLQIIFVNIIPPVFSLHTIFKNEKFKKIEGKSRKLRAITGYLLERYTKVYLRLLFLIKIRPSI